MYENEDSFILITSENFEEYRDIDIAAFSIAAPGACGYHGRKTMVDVHGNVYHTELFDEHALTEEQFLVLSPVFKDYKPEGYRTSPGSRAPVGRNSIWGLETVCSSGMITSKDSFLPTGVHTWENSILHGWTLCCQNWGKVEYKESDVARGTCDALKLKKATREIEFY